MAKLDAYDRVMKFMEKMKDIPLNEFNNRLAEIEKDIFELFKRLEKVHSLSNHFQEVDLSEHVKNLLRMIKDRKKVIKNFPLLSRAAGLF